MLWDYQQLSTASEDHVVGALRRRLIAIRLSPIHITGHSIRRGAAQYVDEMASPVTRSRPSAAVDSRDGCCAR
ncbi:hypothetical protein E4U45_005170 [Claviceps purpurea]|nr:hypothetical protein E4U45_005170 [Claviceps purpurea]